MKIKPLRRAAAVVLFAGAAMLLAPAPAHAEFICHMSDGIRYCYDDGRVPGAPDPVPVEEPPFTPAPVPDPVPVIQPVQPAPASPARVQPAPAPAPVHPVPVPLYVPPQYGGYQAADAPAAAQTAAEVPAEAAPAGAPQSAAAATVVYTAAVPTVSASPTAAASPPSSASGSAIVASGQASSTGTFDALPLVLTVGGVLRAGALVWFVRPVQSALVRLIGAK